MKTKNRSIIIRISLILGLVAATILSGCVTSPSQNTLKGTVSFEDQNVSFSTATCYVTILDVNITNATSKIVAEQVIKDLSPVNGTNSTFQYVISADKLEEGKNYSLFVYIDVDGDVNVSQADYTTTNNYPVTINSKTLDVVVYKVSGDETIDRVFTEAQNNNLADVKLGKIITIKLEENPTTGYSWNMSFTKGLEILKDEFVPPTETGLVGVGGIHEWIVMANSTGHQEVSGIYKRPWENVTGKEETFNLTLNVNP